MSPLIYDDSRQNDANANVGVMVEELHEVKLQLRTQDEHIRILEERVASLLIEQENAVPRNAPHHRDQIPLDGPHWDPSSMPLPVRAAEQSISSLFSAMDARVADLTIVEESEEQILLERSKASIIRDSLISASTVYAESMELLDAFNLPGRYTGEVDPVTQLPNGKGKMVYHVAGRSYDGDWVKGHWHGKGTICNADGDVYVGDIVYDLKEGDGKMIHADGRVLVGKFKNDNPFEGTIVFVDRSRYEGQLLRGMRRGRGSNFFVDGSYYEW